MPAIFIPIAIFLAQIAGALAFRVLAALTMGVMIYKSIEAGLDAVETAINTNIGGVSADILVVIKMAGFTEFMSIIFSAYSAVVAIKLVAGVLRKLTFIPSS